MNIGETRAKAVAEKLIEAGLVKKISDKEKIKFVGVGQEAYRSWLNKRTRAFRALVIILRRICRAPWSKGFLLFGITCAN